MSISKNKIKYIQSLKIRKFRDLHGTFVAEGEKLVFDLLQSCKCRYLAGLPDILRKMNLHAADAEEIAEATTEDLNRASHLKTPSSIIAVFYQPNHDMETVDFSRNLHLVLDGVQDPGNLGTIVRLADWFGIENIICSMDTADIFNPKTVQATMGAIANVKVFHTDLFPFLSSQGKIPIYGTFLEGENIYEEKLSENGFIVMGNEGKGISREIESLVTNKLLIPSFSTGSQTSESLNVAAATAIVCSEFRRRIRA